MHLKTGTSVLFVEFCVVLVLLFCCNAIFIANWFGWLDISPFFSRHFNLLLFDFHSFWSASNWIIEINPEQDRKGKKKKRNRQFYMNVYLNFQIVYNDSNFFFFFLESSCRTFIRFQYPNWINANAEIVSIVNVYPFDG